MSWPDMVNAGFEIGAGLAVLAHCERLYEDKEARGLSIPAVVFFTLWGLWNVFWYPHLDQPWSFYAGLYVTAINALYVAMLVTYSRHPVARWIKRQTVCRIRGHRNDSPDFDGYHLYFCKRCHAEIFGNTWDRILPMPAEVWEEQQRVREVS